jgi:hypothetical protein
MGSNNSKTSKEEDKKDAKTQGTYIKGENPEEDDKREEEIQARLAEMYDRERDNNEKKKTKGIFNILFGKKIRF